MAFSGDYPGAIVVQARNYGYIVNGKHLTNTPKAFCLHTPEEPPDNVPSTPYYFAGTDRDASTTYFVSYLGLVFHCVPELEGAYANAVEGKPYPAWADSKINLNLQTLSIEIEGYAATIHQTMPRGSPQWTALVNLMAHRCKALNIPPGRTFPHKDVSIYRSDPGQLNIPLLVTDVIAALEDDMTLEQLAQMLLDLAVSGNTKAKQAVAALMMDALNDDDASFAGLRTQIQQEADKRIATHAATPHGGAATHKHALSASINGETEEA